MEITGTVKRYNKSPGKAGGVQLDNGVWYNATPITEKIMSGLKPGTRVTLTHGDEDKMVSYIKIEKETPKAENNGYAPRVFIDDWKKNQMITRQTCIKAVAEFVKVEPELKDINKFLKLCTILEEYVYNGHPDGTYTEERLQ